MSEEKEITCKLRRGEDGALYVTCPVDELAKLAADAEEDLEAPPTSEATA